MCIVSVSDDALLDTSSDAVRTAMDATIDLAMEKELVAYYKRYAPALADKAGAVLEQFEGRVPELQEKCRRKYGSTPVFARSRCVFVQTSVTHRRSRKDHGDCLPVAQRACAHE